MKTSIIAAFSVLGLAASPALAENWNVISRSSATVFMVDVDSIAQADGVTSARLARVPAKGESTDLSYSAGTVAFRCAANQSKAGEEIYYGPDGAEQERIDDGYDFEPIARNSLDSYVKELVCEDKRAAASFPTIRAFIEAGRPESR
ncbi:hypothetical protein [Brevundimonas guildfordensis]|jgi:hypothetical protein|nr:hypothetical protein [Brevundimonas guildfordensis]